MTRLAGDGGSESAFHAVVLGAAAAAAVGAFVRPAWTAAIVGLGGAAGAGLASVIARAASVPQGAYVAALAIPIGATLFAWGLATLGRSLRCPDPGVALCALIAVVTGLTSLRWVDPIAERLSLERRGEFRRSVFKSDLATAAAYEVAGYDRLHAPDVYDETTIASLPMALPQTRSAAAAWSIVGIALGALGFLVASVRRRLVERRATRSAP